MELWLLWASDELPPSKDAVLTHRIFSSLWLFQSAAYENLWHENKLFDLSFVAIADCFKNKTIIYFT